MTESSHRMLVAVERTLHNCGSFCYNILSWNIWINAATTRTGTPASSARKWRSPTARSAWTIAGPAPTPASTANSAKAASSGNSAARRPGSGVRKIRGGRGERGKKAKRVKNQRIGGTGVSPVLCSAPEAPRTAGNARPTLLITRRRIVGCVSRTIFLPRQPLMVRETHPTSPLFW